MEQLAELVVSKVAVKGRTYFSDPQSELEVDELVGDCACISRLIDALNLEDTGLKQPCTILALLLKIGRKHPEESLEALETAMKKESAPLPYLCELYYKVYKHAAYQR